ncbi:hypothetical protein CPA40_01245 [Bifidobacterium callitrichos]|uniref:Lipoprotein n=1 Tax=Bifidobacterium callitrichos TaxID=762209 RepID=A0A2T3GDB8_9BIFI|nr:hypothetical protein [Bifidobacterium callitrichos]PST47470.1 hypothetical protein CPA40_01245 [Bifidobacterium callitrichos]
MTAIGATMATVLCLAALTGCATEHSGVQVSSMYCTGQKSDAQYDWPWYDSLDELEQASDVIAYVMITGCTAPDGAGGDTDAAGYDTVINAVVLGGASAGDLPADDEEQTNRIDPPPAGETIVIRGYTAERSGAGKLTVGERYVFFLDAGAREADGYYEMTPALSVFPVTGRTAKEPSVSRNTDGSFALTDSLVARLGIADKAE